MKDGSKLNHSHRRFITRREAASMLRVSVRTLDRWRDAGLLGFIRIGGKILFTQEMLDDDLTSISR